LVELFVHGVEELVGGFGNHAEEEAGGQGGEEDAQAVGEQFQQALIVQLAKALAVGELGVGEGLQHVAAALAEGGTGGLGGSGWEESTELIDGSGRAEALGHLLLLLLQGVELQLLAGVELKDQV
jgi:hypothetical protein